MNRGRHGASVGIGVSVVVAVLLMLAGGLSAKPVHQASSRQEIVTAGRLVTRYGRTRFAPGQRRLLLSAATRARRDARGRVPVCALLAGADSLEADLRLPTIWRHHRVPRATIRHAAGLLSPAERTLLHRVGSRCAKPQRTTGRLIPHTGGSGFTALPKPVESPEQDEGPGIPTGRVRLAKSIGAPSGPGADLHGSDPGAVVAHAASDPVAFFRNADVGIPPDDGSPDEPAAAEGDNVVWYTGNTSVALSTNAGRTFKIFDPSTILPDDGLPSCCDQQVSYSPQQNLFVWVIQYWCGAGTSKPATTDCDEDGTTSNRVRIAVASPQALIADASNPGAAWTYWDITPETFGQPAGSWFDRSDLGVDIFDMNWTVDVARGNSGVASILARIGLAQLARRGPISFSYITDSTQRMTVAQGLDSGITYYVGTDSLSQQKIWAWAAFSNTLFRHDVNHSSVPNVNSAIDGTDGNDWYDRYGIFPGAIESATVSGSTLYTAQGTGRQACTADCSSDHPPLHTQFSEPAIFISKYDIHFWTDVGERWIWNSNLAYAWPALQTDAAGDVGLAFRASAENQNAQPVAGLLTPSEQFVFAEGEGLPHETGDYYSLRPGRTPHSFVMTAQTVESRPGGSDMHWQYIEYGTGASPYVSPPHVQITSPANFASVADGADVSYSAAVSDPVDGTLPDSAIRWTEDGSFIGSGPTIDHVETAVGAHAITVTATNGDGRSASESITITVDAPPPTVTTPAPGSPLTVAITSPADGSSYAGPYNHDPQDPNGDCVTVAFVSSATGETGPVSYTWTDSMNRGAARQVSTQASPTLDLCDDGGYDSVATHDISVSATDGAQASIASIRVVIIGPSPPR